MSKTLNMTEGRPLRLLIRFALPLMFANMFQQLYTVVDTAIVGRGVSMTALAALGSVDWLNWMMLGIAQGFTQGFSVRIAQKFGEGDQKGLQRYMGQAAIISAVLAVLCTVLGQLTMPLFFWVLRVPPGLEDMAALYTRILMGGVPAIFFFNYCSSVLRAVGDSKTPLTAIAVAAVTNIALDYVTVMVFDWGIAGAAGATLASQCLSGAICLWRIFRTPQLRFSKTDMRPQTESIQNLLRLGAPSAFKNLMVAVGGMAVMMVVNQCSTPFIAGVTATNKLYGLLEIAALSYGYAVITYVGQNYGAMRHDRIKSGMKSATVLALVTSVIIGAVMIVFGRSIVSVFISADTPEETAAACKAAYQYLCVMAGGMPVLYMLYLLLSALQGLGDAVRPMVSGFVELAMRVSVALIVGLAGGETGIFAAEIAAWVGAAGYLLCHFRKRMRE